MRKNRYLIFILTCFLLLNHSFLKAGIHSFQGFKWKTLNCQCEPVARHEASFVEANDKFYLLGGRRIQEVSIFNPETGTGALCLHSLPDGMAHNQFGIKGNFLLPPDAVLLEVHQN